MDDISADFQNLMDYCASDVDATFSVFREVPDLDDHFDYHLCFQSYKTDSKYVVNIFAVF